MPQRKLTNESPLLFISFSLSLSNQHRTPFFIDELICITVFISQCPDINAGWLELSVIASVPAIFPIRGMKHQLSPAIVNFEFQVRGFNRVQRIDNIVFRVPVRGESTWNIYLAVDIDIYFLFNHRRIYEELVCTFRVKNKRPEVWNPATGEITLVRIYDLVDDRVQLPVQLEPYGSVFVVFREPASSNRVISIEKNNRSILSSKHFPLSQRKLYADVFNSFTIAFWAKPEINILLNPHFTMGSISQPWTEFYAIYPTAGKELYGEGHAICGVAVGRNGIAVWENASGSPVLVLAVPIAIYGWGHIAITYQDGQPSVYVNGKLIQKGQKTNMRVHPTLDQAFLNEGASYYNGDMSKPVLFNEVLTEDRIKILSKERPPDVNSGFIVEMSGHSKPSLLIKENGNYILRHHNRKTSSISISEIDQPLELKGPWKVNFPPDLGAPFQIELPELISLHQHSVDGVKYFSGTATYTIDFAFSKRSPGSKLYFLDLGRIEIIAEVKLNETDFGVLWKRPFQTDVTTALKDGLNRLEIQLDVVDEHNGE